VGFTPYLLLDYRSLAPVRELSGETIPPYLSGPQGPALKAWDEWPLPLDAPAIIIIDTL